MIPGRMCKSEEVKQQHRQKAKEADVNEQVTPVDTQDSIPQGTPWVNEAQLRGGLQKVKKPGSVSAPSVLSACDCSWTLSPGSSGLPCI